MLANPTWTLGGRLRATPILAGIDQADLARPMRISRNSISNYENGRAESNASTFMRWATAAGVTLDWLASGIDTPPHPDPSTAGIRP